MRKIIISILLSAVITALMTSIACAAGEITESPNLKININGKIGTYQDVPIIVNSRSMLPLRAILTNLGVPNDDSHIIWNDIDKSVTILANSGKIYLKVGDSTAVVDNAQITLDAAPVNYKNRVYIPTRFIAQSLNKKVAWDGSLSMVLIRDPEEFNSIRGILEESQSAMNTVERCILNENTSLKVTKGNDAYNFSYSSATKVDMKKKICSSQLTLKQTTPDNRNHTFNFEAFMANNSTYIKNSSTGSWGKVEEMSENDYNKQFVYDDTAPDEVDCAGLIISNSQSTDVISLKGDMNLADLLKKNLDFMGFQQYSVKETHVEITIDKSTYMVRSLSLRATGNVVGGVWGNAGFDTDMTFIYSDFNVIFDVAIPDGI